MLIFPRARNLQFSEGSAVQFDGLRKVDPQCHTTIAALWVDCLPHRRAKLALRDAIALMGAAPPLRFAFVHLGRFQFTTRRSGLREAVRAPLPSIVIMFAKPKSKDSISETGTPVSLDMSNLVMLDCLRSSRICCHRFDCSLAIVLGSSFSHPRRDIST